MEVAILGVFDSLPIGLAVRDLPGRYVFVN